MAEKNRQIAEAVVKAVGGTANITSVTHCMTRLRFVLKDKSIPNKKEVEKIPGVMGVNIAGGQYQVIIGNSVGNVYKEVVAATGISDTAVGGDAAEHIEKVNPIVAALDFIAGCMTPLFTAIIAGGLVKVLLVIFGPTLLNVMQTTSDTYILMNALGDAPFYFLPVLVAFTASRKLNCNSYLSVMVASVLIYPDVITLLAGDSATHLFGVIPVVHGSYSSSIIPAMLSTLLLKYVEKLVDRITPEWSKSFLKPLLIVMIVTPITLCAIAPLGLIIGNGLQSVINGIYGFAPWLAMMLFAGFMPFIVMTGMHWAFVPAGATFGAAFKTKDKEMKKMAFPAAVAALLAGVTEPAMYGVTLKLKKPMVAACISGGIGGLIVGILQVKSYAFVTPSMTSLVQFISPDGGKNFLYAVIIFAVTLVLSFVLSFILTKGEAEEEAAEETELQKSAAVLTGKVEIEAPVKGKVYAPFDGVCENLFDTLHAIGITSDNGIEMLIHVGLETVALKGEPFKAHTGNGEHFKKGALLLEFDIDAIQKAGCEIQTPVIITNAEELGGVTVENERLVIGG